MSLLMSAKVRNLSQIGEGSGYYYFCRADFLICVKKTQMFGILLCRKSMGGIIRKFPLIELLLY